jgi:alcohol dehydrogenase (cytochrome c)
MIIIDWKQRRTRMRQLQNSVSYKSPLQGTGKRCSGMLQTRRRTDTQRRGAVMLAIGLSLLGGTELACARDVTFERLSATDAEPENWLMVHKDYAATRFSSLKQIDRSNAKDLKLVFATGLGGGEAAGIFPNSAMEASALVEDGFVYLSDGWSNVYKIDVRAGDSGSIVWKTDPGIDKTAVALPASRGVALYGDMVIELTVDGRVVSLKKDNGRVLFDENVKTNSLEAFTAAPLVVKNKLIIAASGGDSGARGWLAAFDLDTKKIVWRWYPVPSPGQPGSETWKDGHDAWKTGGGGIWATGAYDVRSNRLFWGTGNPNKANDSAGRAGDNLFTESSVALGADDGGLLWYFQYTPNDPFDFDEVGAQMLLDVPIDGKPRSVLSHFGRNGFYYTLDEQDGRFLKGGAYVSKLTWSRGLDPQTGNPLEYQRGRLVQKYATQPQRDRGPIDVCPEQRGGVNYWPPAYSPITRLTYAGTWEGCHTITVVPDKHMGGSITDYDHVSGSLVSVDPTTARVISRRLSESPNTAGATATAGRLVITAFRDGVFEVLDDESLQPLYSMNVGTYIGAPPTVYAVNGKEYIAILTGGGLSPRLIGPNANKTSYTIESVPMLMVFSL